MPHDLLRVDSLFLAHYIERAGTGTVDVIALCRKVSLSEPAFEQRGGQFVTTLWRDSSRFFPGVPQSRSALLYGAPHKALIYAQAHNDA